MQVNRHSFAFARIKLKNKKKRYTDDGNFSPFRGKRNSNESGYDAALREFKEESLIDITSFGLHRQKYQANLRKSRKMIESFSAQKTTFSVMLIGPGAKIINAYSYGNDSIKFVTIVDESNIQTTINETIKKVVIQPSVIFTILDLHLRRSPKQDRVIGMLLGERSGNTIAIKSSIVSANENVGKCTSICTEFQFKKKKKNSTRIWCIKEINYLNSLLDGNPII